MASGTTATSHQPARRSGIATLPSYIDGNVAQDVRAGDSCDVAVLAGTTGHAPLPPYPAPAVTANRTAADGHGAADRPRRRTTAGADGARGTTATSHERARRSGIATLPSYIDGNVAQDVRAGDSCDVAVVAGTTGHTLPPYPAHAVPAPHTRADGHGAADRPRRHPTRTDDGAGVQRQRRTNRPAAAGLRRYRRISTATSHSTCERAIRATLPSSAPAPPATPPFPVPSPAVTAPRREPTATAPPTDHARGATRRADGVGVRRQRRTNELAAAGLRRYRCISTATSHRTCERAFRVTLP
jgi:hypothetical protein